MRVAFRVLCEFGLRFAAGVNSRILLYSGPENDFCLDGSKRFCNLTNDEVAVLGPELVGQLFVGETEEGFPPCQVAQLLRDHRDSEVIPPLRGDKDTTMFKTKWWTRAGHRTEPWVIGFNQSCCLLQLCSSCCPTQPEWATQWCVLNSKAEYVRSRVCRTDPADGPGTGTPDLPSSLSATDKKKNAVRPREKNLARYSCSVVIWGGVSGSKHLPGFRVGDTPSVRNQREIMIFFQNQGHPLKHSKPVKHSRKSLLQTSTGAKSTQCMENGMNLFEIGISQTSGGVSINVHEDEPLEMKHSHPSGEVLQCFPRALVVLGDVHDVRVLADGLPQLRMVHAVLKCADIFNSRNLGCLSDVHAGASHCGDQSQVPKETTCMLRDVEA